MKEEIRWLISIERMAGNLYGKAADYFSADEELSTFLHDLAEDEAWHYHIMGSAAEYTRTHPEVEPLQLLLDARTREKIHAPFLENTRLLKQGLLTKDSIVDCIGITEFSEWNELFLYVVNSLKKESREFQYVAARMQGHLQHIKDFLASRPEAASLLEKMRKLPEVWREKILIVEDSPSLLEIMDSILSRYYMTTTAENGRAGFEKLKENHFDVIISDIDMPEMNGMELYREAIKYDPDIGGRFLFFSAFKTEEHENFLREHHIPYLMKPASLADIREKIRFILEQSRHRIEAKAL
jgi:CheY-like chemotaxis protein